MTRLLQDVSYALRQFRRNPAFAVMVVLTLAMGIGANTAIFSVIEAVILRPLPYKDPTGLALLADSDDPESGGFLLKDIRALKSRNRSFEDIAFYYRDSGFSRVVLTGGIEPESAQGAFVSANFFSVMGVAPVLGRSFTSREEVQREHVVVLGHSLWLKHFGASNDVVGRMLQIDGTSHEIIGVLPSTFHFPAMDQQFWAPVTTNRYWDDPAASKIDARHSRYAYLRWQAVGRLRKSATVAQARTELSTIFAALSEADADPNRGAGVVVTPLRVKLSGNTRLAFIVLFCAVFFVLLISCGNVATLLLARSVSREREIAVRTALGAGCGRLARQLLTESAVLALFAGAAGLWLASAGVRALIALAPPGIPRIEEAGFNPSVLAFTGAISFFAAAIFGLAPTWKLLREQRGGLFRGGVSSGKSRRGARSTLIIIEFALAVVLLTGSSLLVRSFLVLQAVDPGFQSGRLLTVNISLPSATPESRNGLYDAVLDRVRTIPGIQAAGEVDALFELEQMNNLGLRAVEGQAPEPKDRWTPLKWVPIRGDYFQTMGTPLLRGRYFKPEDDEHSALVAIIDESLARRYWPGQDPMGRHFKGQDPRGHNDEWLTVVGIVPDMRRSGLENNPIPHVFQPWGQAIDGDRTSCLVVRTAVDARAIARDLRSAIRGLSGNAIISPVATVEEQLSGQLSPRRFQTLLLGLFSAMALTLATLGIFGVMHHSVAERTREIGIRTALGARPGDVLSLVLAEATRLIVWGIALGSCAAFALTRFMASLLFGVRPTDPLTFVGVPSLLVTVALIASYIPARRAVKIDTMATLRYE